MGTIVPARPQSHVGPKSRTIAADSAGSATVSGFGQTCNPYDELGVTAVINCQGTMTMLGESILRPELEAVMAMAGRHFVSIPDLEVAAGKRIAEMLKLPDGYAAIVTTGASKAPPSAMAEIFKISRCPNIP